MPTIEYKTKYTADDSKAIASFDRQIAKLKQLEAQAEATQKKLAALGRSMPGVASAIGALGNLGKAFASVDAAAGRTHDAVRKVGNDTGGMTRSATKAAELHKRLKDLEAQAQAAAAAIAGITPPPGAGGGGGQPAPGGGPGRGGVAAGAMRSIGSRAVGLVDQAAKAVGGAWQDAAQGARDFQGRVAGEVMAFRDERRELAGLMGESSPGARVVRSSLGLMRGAGMTAREEAEFSTEYYNSAAIGRDKGNLGAAGPARDKLEQDIRLVGAQFGVRAGIAPGTAGDIAGAIGTYKKIGSAADVAGELAGVHYGLDQGRGRMTALMKSELSQAGSKVSAGYATDLPELAAMIGVLSGGAKSGGSAGTSYGQMSRLLNEASGPDAEFLKRIGVSDQKGDLAKLHKLTDYFKANNVTDINRHLAENGFGNQTDRNQIAFAVSQIGVIDQRVAEARRRTRDPAEFLAKNEAFQKSGLGYSRRIAAEAEAGEVERGLQDEARVNLRRQGHALRMTRPMVTPKAGSYEGNSRAWWLGVTNTLGLGDFDGEQEMDEQEGIASLRVRAANVGLDLQKKYPELLKQQGMPWLLNAGGLWSSGRTRDTDNVRDTQIAQAVAEIEKLEKAAGKLDRAAEALHGAAGAIAGAGQGGLPPAVGKPAVAPKR